MVSGEKIKLGLDKRGSSPEKWIEKEPDTFWGSPDRKVEHELDAYGTKSGPRMERVSNVLETSLADQAPSEHLVDGEF